MKIKCLQIFLLETALFAYALVIPTASESSAMGYEMYNGPAAIQNTQKIFQGLSSAQKWLTVLSALGVVAGPAGEAIDGALAGADAAAMGGLSSSGAVAGASADEGITAATEIAEGKGASAAGIDPESTLSPRSSLSIAGHELSATGKHAAPAHK